MFANTGVQTLCYEHLLDITIDILRLCQTHFDNKSY